MGEESDLTKFNGVMVWVSAFLIAVVGATAFALTTFQLKSDAKDDKAEMIRRMDRLEGKQDDSLGKQMEILKILKEDR